MVGFNWWEEESIDKLCQVLNRTCKQIISYFTDGDPEIDNLPRMSAFLSDFPAGTPY